VHRAVKRDRSASAVERLLVNDGMEERRKEVAVCCVELPCGAATQRTTSVV